MSDQIKPVFVVVGVGGMGKAITRRLGSGKQVMIADFNETTLNAAAEELRGDGFDVHTQVVDVSKAESFAALAQAAAALGPVTLIAHTAGLSPTMASAEGVFRVDLLGVALMLDTFAGVIAPGGAGLVIASMAGQTAALYNMIPAEDVRALATAPVDQLLSLPCVTSVDNPGQAYSLAKRANQVRVQAAAGPWGARGARVNSISPGIISTPMGQLELASPAGGEMRAMIAGSAMKRLGTPEDITEAAAFLLSPQSSFITGTDLLVDGGVIAAMGFGALARTA